MLIFAVLACSDPVLPPLAPPPVDLTAAVAASKVEADEPVELTLSLVAAEGWTLQLQEPTAEGLTVTQTEQDGPTLIGDRQRTRLRYRLTGEPGSYIIQPGAALAEGPGDQERELLPPPIFVDIGVEGPKGGELAGLIEAPPPPEPPWALIAAGALAGIGLIGGLLWWARRPVPVPPPEPLDDRARRLWREARAEQHTDHDLAIALSGVMRDYLERRYDWPATSRSSREILAFLSERIPAALRLKLSAVLEANDRLKYAREGGGEAFFDSLEEGFHEILAATRPPPDEEAE